MDAETLNAIAALESRMRWLAGMYEREWKIAARARDQWSTELDALIDKVALLDECITELERVVSNNADVE